MEDGSLRFLQLEQPRVRVDQAYKQIEALLNDKRIKAFVNQPGSLKYSIGNDLRNE